MAMGKREGSQQQQIFVDAAGLRSPEHPFYRRLNAVLAEHGFDDFVEQLCQKFYDPKQGRPSIAPGVYLRMLLIGYFEGIDSERGIAWPGADSLALREFLELRWTRAPRIIRVCRERAAGWIWRPTKRCSSGSLECWRKRIW